MDPFYDQLMKQQQQQQAQQQAFHEQVVSDPTRALIDRANQSDAYQLMNSGDRSQAEQARLQASYMNPHSSEIQKYRDFLQNMAFFGGGPSLAQTQLQSGMGQAMGQAQAMAASQRGINPALAARLAAQSQAGLQHQTNVQSTMLRSQEQQQALGLLGGRAGQSQSYDTAQMQAQSAANSARNTATMGIVSAAVGGGMQGAGSAGMTAALGKGTPGAAPVGAPGSSPFPTPAPYAQGGVIPGQAQAQGDSPTNDTVPAMLSPGEAVIPRSVMQSDNPGEKAKEFINQLKAQKERKAGEAPSYAKLLKMHREMGEHLEKLCKGGKVG